MSLLFVTINIVEVFYIRDISTSKNPKILLLVPQFAILGLWGYIMLGWLLDRFDNLREEWSEASVPPGASAQPSNDFSQSQTFLGLIVPRLRPFQMVWPVVTNADYLLQESNSSQDSAVVGTLFGIAV